MQGARCYEVGPRTLAPWDSGKGLGSPTPAKEVLVNFQSYSLPPTLEDLRDGNFGVWLWGLGWCGGNQSPLSRAASGHYLWGPPHLQPQPGLGVLGSLARSDPTPFCP